MGFLHSAFNWRRRARRVVSSSSRFSAANSPVRRRTCRFEQVEPRRLLSADPIRVGAVYFEEATGQDEAGDLIEITWTGGAPGTQLTSLVIETDKLGDGLTIGDVLFDTEPGTGGAFGSVGLSILQSDGIDAVGAQVVDGGTTLTLTFAGFDPGEKLLVSVDVDEQGFLGPNAVAEGNEFEGSILAATFAADHFFDVTGSDIFFDYYGGNLAGSGLNLPPDEYVPPSDIPRPVHTAGAIFSLEQEPLPISIAGSVFEDPDADNQQDPGEPGLAGVGLQLYRLEGAEYVATGQTTVTSAAGDLGKYRFDGLLPGTYRIVETQPDGFLSVGVTAGTVDGQTRGVATGADVISAVELLGGEDSVDNDFAETRPISLSGHVYHDRNDDGAMDTGEEGIGGVLVRVSYVPGLDPPVDPIEVHTDQNGYWEVKGLYPGEFVVEEVQPGGYLDGLDSAGTAGGTAHNPGDRIDGFGLNGGESGREYNFGELMPSSVSGRVIADSSGNCLYDPGDTLLEGVTVYLLDADQPFGSVPGGRIATTLTDSAGEYSFTGLAPGVYGVEEIQPEGYYDGGDHVGTAGGKLAPPDSLTGIVLVSGTAATRYDFCELEPVGLSGFVYVDQNNNGLRENGEEGIAGVTLRLLDAAGNPTGATTTTDGSGFYRFEGLEPLAVYGVEEIQPAGFYDGLDTPGTAGGTAHNPGDSITGVAIPPGQTAEENNFGELRPASIAGRVHVELNGNCTVDPGEPLLAGVTIWLLDASGSRIRSTLTDEMGEYLFDNLEPGTYGVEEIQPAGYFDGSDHVGSAGGALDGNDRIVGATLGSGTAAVEYNFCEVLPASIGGRVHADLNRNGTADPGEPLLAGVTVWLLDGWGNRIRSTLTDEMGEYRFDNLEPGTYGVEEIQPAGYFDGSDHVGSAGGALDGNDRIVGAKLVSGAKAVEYNFCEVLPASLSGHVFKDGPTIKVGPFEETPDPADLRDGVRTSDDTPIAGVVLQLGDATGEPILDAAGRARTAVTGADGYYEFTNLAPGNYTILEVHPDGYTDSIDTPGSGGGTAVNAHEAVNPLILGELTVDPRNDAILGVRLNSGDMAVDYNFSEVLVVRLPFIPPPPPPPPPPSPPDSPPPIEPSVRPPELRYIPSSGIDMLPELGRANEFLTAYTWHLSVVNAGRPRRDSDEDRTAATESVAPFNPASWTETDLNESHWVLANEAGQPVTEFDFGLAGGIPLTGDFDGDGITEVAVFVRGVWFIDLNGNGIWDEGDLWARLGTEHDLPVTGDWDGDGKTDIGIFGPAWEGDARAIAAEPGLPDSDNEPTGRPKNVPPAAEEATVGWRTMRLSSRGGLRADLIDHVFQYGTASDVPIAGEWNGDGVTNIGLFREGSWYLDVDGSGQWSESDVYVDGFGELGDLPVVGDFNGDGIDEIGFYRNGAVQTDQQTLDPTDAPAGEVMAK
ncbi:MAG: SdrD B-like domain-containing protein [Planctomycetota bacterium]